MGTNDWAWGAPQGVRGSDIGGQGGLEPSTGASGDNLWGTVLGGIFSPSTVSSLTQTFDLTGQTNTMLTFNEWIETGDPLFDMAQILVNGTPVYMSDGDSGEAWRTTTVDLSVFDGEPMVDIEFQLSSTGAVERVGWYIDDVSITAVPEPVSFGLLLMGALGLMTYRRSKR